MEALGGEVVTLKWHDAALIVFVLVTLAVSAMPKLGRYEVTSGGPGGSLLVKVDTWTGEAWIVHAFQAKNGAEGWKKIAQP